MNNVELIDKLNKNKRLEKAEWVSLISSSGEKEREYAAGIAREIAVGRFGKKIFFRGIIEFSNFCRCNCLYCGIRASNANANRYRLTKEEILGCCENGYNAGFRTFVLQSGEDVYYTDDILSEIIYSIRNKYTDCAITLSLGEKPYESYKHFFDAGANRYLLRHETADAEHYARLHPAYQSYENRMRCLYDLKSIGYQTGCGMMIGSPYQTAENLADDMIFMKKFDPQMIGTGPFLPHGQTPFAAFTPGSAELTLLMLSLCRIMLPDVLLPATTALGTLRGDGRQKGVLAGCNVIMPNLSPVADRKKYTLYDNKAITGEDAAESLRTLQSHLEQIGYTLTVSRGDYNGDVKR